MECTRLAGDLGRLGVAGIRPSRAVKSADGMGRSDADDLLMVSPAKLVFDLVLPTEEEVPHAMIVREGDRQLLQGGWS